MTPDQIVTAELLAGLTKCPHCKADLIHKLNTSTFECRTEIQIGTTFGSNRGRSCLVRESATLRARVKELEEWINSLDEIGSHSGKSDDREWNGEMGWIYPDNAVYYGPKRPTKKGTK